MKNVLYVLGIFIVFSTSIQAQSELEESIKFYPLDFGNYWEYMSIEDDLIFGLDTSYYSITVLTDTLMPNGKKYKLLKVNYFGSDYSPEYYQRIDSTKANVYEYNGEEYLIDSLLSKANDSSLAGRGSHGFSETMCLQISTDTLFNLSFETKLFKNIKQPIDFEYKLAKGLGYIGEEICEGTCYQEFLIHAKIGDKVYGESVTALGKYSNTQRKDFRLYQNYPNPFNPMTKIKYEIGTTGITKLIVYNILGQNVKTIINEYKNPGTYEIQFDASNLPSGIYYYRLESGSFSKVNKMLVLK